MGGEIRIDFNKNQDGKFELTVADNGVGLPDSFDVRQTKSLGLELVTALTSQLGGTIDASDRGGATFTILFAELKPKER